MSIIRTAVIGGGAAGMMAAVFASRKGEKVTVFEKNQKIGRKLYITGKGRCNLTNHCDINTVIQNTPVNGRFLYSALHFFSPEDTIRFFEEQGLPLKTERGNRVFPVSDRAADVVDTLLWTAKKSGCTIRHQTVKELIIKDGQISGVVTADESIPFDRVIIATGGLSYPVTGSTGDGYRFAKKAGHTIIPVKPSLVPLETIEPIDKQANKLLLKNIAVNVYDTENNNKKIYSDFGEMQLMDYGLSGAVIRSASSHMRKMREGKYRIEADMKPALSEKKLDLRLQREFAERNKDTYESILRSLMPKEMIGMFLRLSDIPYDKISSEITKEERHRIVYDLKHLTFTIKDFRPVDEAIVTSGGVSVKEINPKTMESKLISGLYFAGEVIDVDAYTGGFNLQAAFATGALAGSGKD